MSTVSETIDTAIEEVTRARKLVASIKNPQIRKQDDLDALKSVAYAWFNTHRPAISRSVGELDLAPTDGQYQIVLSCTAKSAAKTSYLDALRKVRSLLIDLRGAFLTVPVKSNNASEDDLAPDFSPLVGNNEMREILSRRWNECRKCVSVDAHLAAIVMMGGLLEALFVARANKMSDKTPLVSSAAAPKDKITGKTLNYQEWMLDSYIKVGRELQWITESAKDFADTLKEYRNYVHPEKERRHGIVLGHNDSTMLWQVTKALVRQLLLSAS